MDALKPLLRSPRGQHRPAAAAPEEPLRSELFSLDLLKQHARTVARRQKFDLRSRPDLLLSGQDANEKLLDGSNTETVTREKQRGITAAAEWLWDNFHLLEDQVGTPRRLQPRGVSGR